MCTAKKRGTMTVSNSGGASKIIRPDLLIDSIVTEEESSSVSF